MVLVVAVALAFAIFVIAIPATTLLDSQWEPATKASVIQASTSIFGGIAGFLALVAAVLAYDDTQRRPRLDLRVRNSVNALSFQLENTGAVPAVNPRIVVRCLTHAYVRPPEDGVGPGRHSVQWRLSEYLTGGFGWQRLTWVPLGTSSVIHPDLTLETPPLDFGPLARQAGSSSESDGRITLELKISWTADRAELLSERTSIRFPTGRDETYY